MHREKSILIVGAGSIGKRHLRNLKSLGWNNIMVLRREPDPVFEADYSVMVVTGYEQLEETPFAVIACNPTSLHLEPLRYAVDKGAHLFMEKPLIHTAEGLREAEELLKEHRGHFFIGYMLRFHPAIRVIHRIVSDSLHGNPVIPSKLISELNEEFSKEAMVPFPTASILIPESEQERKHCLITANAKIRLGQPFSARLEFGSYLPGWPYADYKESYAARKELGGGVINTISHELDLICHFFGVPEKITAAAFNFDKLKIEAEEMCDALFHYPQMAVSLHLDYLQKEYDRRIRILFDEGSLEWNWKSEKITFSSAVGQKIVIHAPMGDLNHLYMSEMSSFLKLIDQREVVHPLDSGYALLNTRLLLLMHQAATSGNRVKV